MSPQRPAASATWITRTITIGRCSSLRRMLVGGLRWINMSGVRLALTRPRASGMIITATAWDNAFINFDQCGWFPAPNYVVMKLWREHYAPQRIAVELSPLPGAPEGKPGRLDTVATRSADGKTLYLKAVNPADEPCRVALRLARGTIRTASMQVVAPGELAARNSLDAPQRVRPQPGAVEQQGQTVRFVLPPFSCAAVKIGCD